MTGEPHPIIAVEGLDGVGKSTLTRALAQALGAALLTSPPPLRASRTPWMGVDLRAHFDGRDEAARRLYYRFANLLVSEEARRAREAGPVVIDRYWPSTVAFAYGADPDQEAARWLGRYPPELVVPDVLLLLTASEAARLARAAERGLATTVEEARLARSRTTRRSVQRALMAFQPFLIDTSALAPEGVLEAALAHLRAVGVTPPAGVGSGASARG